MFNNSKAAAWKILVIIQYFWCIYAASKLMAPKMAQNVHKGDNRKRNIGIFLENFWDFWRTSGIRDFFSRDSYLKQSGFLESRDLDPQDSGFFLISEVLSRSFFKSRDLNPGDSGFSWFRNFYPEIVPEINAKFPEFPSLGFSQNPRDNCWIPGIFIPGFSQNPRNFHHWDFRKILGIIAKSPEFLSRDFRKIPGISFPGIFAKSSG